MVFVQFVVTCRGVTLLFPSLLPFPPLHSMFFPFLSFPALPVTSMWHALINPASTGGFGRAVQGKPDNGKEQELQPILPLNANE